MEQGRVVAVIPARYDSSRFPGKPLARIANVPMIAHVVARAREAGCFSDVIVATDDDRIAAAAAAAGAHAVMTGRCSSGTDRVAEAVRPINAEVVINVQGDEPALPPENLRRVAAFMLRRPDVGLVTLALPGRDGDLDEPNVVKVVCDQTGRALYFSRAAVPFPRNPSPGVVRRHVGLYGFRREALLQFTSWPQTPLERAEGLEQLRALEHGMAIQVLDAAGDSVAVDVPDDIATAEAAVLALARRARGDSEQGRGIGIETSGAPR